MSQPDNYDALIDQPRLKELRDTPRWGSILFALRHLTCAAMLFSSTQSYAQNSEIEDVSILSLIVNPEKYHGKKVYLGAYATVRFEGDSLCAVQKPASSKDCLWLQFDDGPYKTEKDIARFDRAKKKWERYNGKRITLVGTFNKENTGHFGLFSGAIEHITSVSRAP